MIPELLVWWKRFIGLGRSAYPAFLDTMASNFFCKTASTGDDDDDDGGGGRWRGVTSWLSESARPPTLSWHWENPKNWISKRRGHTISPASPHCLKIFSTKNWLDLIFLVCERWFATLHSTLGLGIESTSGLSRIVDFTWLSSETMEEREEQDGPLV